jgi:hypothetical protein
MPRSPSDRRSTEFAMKASIFSGIKQSLSSLEQWYYQTPERSLNKAYAAALKIKEIEDEHFGGQKISPGFGHSKSVFAYFESELRRYLKVAQVRMAEFRACNRIIDTTKATPTDSPLNNGGSTYGSSTRNLSTAEVNQPVDTYTITARPYDSEEAVSFDNPVQGLLERLQFIDGILTRYDAQPPANPLGLMRSPDPFNPFLAKSSAPQPKSVADSRIKGNGDAGSLYRMENQDNLSSNESKVEGSSFVPRSIIRTANQFKRELDPNQEMEEEMLNDFRLSKARTRIALRFLMLLIIVPLLTQQISKNFLIAPVIDHFKVTEKIEIAINSEVEERIFRELNQFEQRLKFQNLIAEAPVFSADQVEARLKNRAKELSLEYRWELSEPIKNIVADGFGLIAFTVLVFTGQRQIAALKSLMDEVIYGLSDSAKAFIIILFTDVFVGFHSPHGWTVVMHNILQHFGLPRNEDFVDMFISTFPVMLDAVFKYWIFRYLNQVSPSAVATYKNMNE